MVIIDRKVEQKIFVGDVITVTVVDIVEDVVRLAIEAPRDVSIKRGEYLSTTRETS